VLWILGSSWWGSRSSSLSPLYGRRRGDTARPSVRAALVGLGWGILSPIAIVIAAITVVGLPLAFLTAAVYVSWCALPASPSRSGWVGCCWRPRTRGARKERS